MGNYKKVKIKTRKLKKFVLLLIFSFTLYVISNLVLISPNLQNIPFAAAQPTRSEIRGVWMTNNDLNIMRDRRKLNDSLTQLKRLNFNTIYPVVWNSGYAMYPSATAQKIGIQNFLFKGTQGQDILADVIAQAHSQGLLVIPWFEFGFMAPTTSELAVNRKNWLTVKRDRGLNSINEDGEVVWLNPFHPEVQEFITNLVLEVVSNYDVDGIQFDDHMSLPKEFGYDDYTINLYRKEALLKNQACALSRRRIASKPKLLPKVVSQAKDSKPIPQPSPQNCLIIPTEPSINADDPNWVKWRANKITEFMVRLNKVVKQKNPKAIFSVSPNYFDFAYKEQLQDWVAWVRQDIVDELIVQAYRPDLQGFLNLINRPEIETTRQKTLTGIAVLSGLRTNPAPIRQIQLQVQAVKERNLGLSFFYFSSLWNYGPEPIAERQTQFRSFLSSPIRNNDFGPLIN
ncbi:hypothetical protein Syn7502_00416 [Synechococcus sp. PCC 7502]|nr:hypothetical protein Syn7502_00416 [Synechococcus sp. PCC 7502]